MDTDGGNTNFQYSGPAAPQAPLAEHAPLVAAAPSDQIIQWDASEFIDHHKGFGWFVLLGLATIVLSGITFLLSKSILSVGVIIIAAMAFGAYALQKPRTLTYTLLPSTLKIGPKSYSYDDFRSFSVHQEGALYNVILQPVKRFMPYITIYFAETDGEKIFDALASHLPAEEREADPIDTFMRKIRF